MVALRFFPVVIDDARTITENLILRGLIASKVSLLWHPVVGVRHAVLPLVASSLRSGDELSASALLRGLGATSTPTAVVITFATLGSLDLGFDNCCGSRRFVRAGSIRMAQLGEAGSEACAKGTTVGNHPIIDIRGLTLSTDPIEPEGNQPVRIGSRCWRT